MSRPRLLSGLAALSLLVAAWSTEAAPLAKVAIQLNWKFQYEFAAPIAAVEKGFYREAGLEVQLLEGGPNVDPFTPVAQGRIPFGMAGSSLVVNRAQGQPVVALAALMQHSAVGLLARKGAGIDSVHDLVGKRLAISFDTADEIRAYLQSQGLAPSAYNRQEKHLDLHDLAAGRADAISVYVSNELFLAQDHIDDYVLLTPRSAGIDLFGNVLFTNETTLMTRPELVKAFRKATLKGWEYALAHPEEVADIILARYNSQGKSREHLLFEAAKLRELTRPDIVEPGYMSPGRWRHVADVYAGQGRIPANFDLTGFVYDPDAKPDLTWLYWTLAGTLLALAVTGGILWQFHRLNTRLRAEVEERRHTEIALLDAKREAEAASRAKSEFLSTMSHEIRTPMNGVLGMIQLLRESEVDAEQREYLDIAHTSAQGLLAILNDILDLSKIEAGMMEVHAMPFSLAHVITECVRTLGHKAAEKGIAVDTRIAAEIPPEMLGDPVRVRQVLLNLVGNAIKFTEHGRVGITAELAQRDQDGVTVRLAVSDTGIGIPPENQARIFDAFTQADASHTRTYGGTGLGLAIVRKLVELMGGRIWLESEAGRGSTFHFTLRFQPAAPGTTAEEATMAGKASAPQGMRPVRVLLVEDNPVNQQVAAGLLGKLGLDTDIAENGQQALEMEAASGPYDVILMDLEMPVMDGFDATRALRARGVETPIVALTAHALTGYRERCMEAGMDNFLAKPLKFEDLKAALAQP